MVEPFEYVPPLVSAGLAFIPLVAVLRAYARTRSVRLLFAALAFLAFVVTGIALLAAHAAPQRYQDSAEWIEFASDIVIVALFALSFLWPRKEPTDG